MRPPWLKRTSALAAVLAVSAVGKMVAADIPPPSYCELYPEQCFRLGGPTRAHFLGMLQQVISAVPRVRGYRCNVERKIIDAVGFGRSARRAAPREISENLWCFHRGTDPRKGHPDVTIAVRLSVLPVVLPEGEASEKALDLLVFAAPKGVYFVFGKIREWRDLEGVVHRGRGQANASSQAADERIYEEEEVVANGPYLVSAEVGIDSDSPAALDAFAGGLDRAAISALMAREARRRKADREARPITGVLRQ